LALLRLLKEAAVDRLLEAQRPRAAFSAVHMEFDKVEIKRLVTLLRTVATSTAESAEHFQLAHHDVSNAFKSLAARADTRATSWRNWSSCMSPRSTTPPTASRR
jgi:hypothetical protein